MRTITFFIAALALTGCSLRPRYADFIGKETTAPVKLQLVEKKSGLPVAGAFIDVGEARTKVSLKTDADGVFLLPVDKRLVDDNSLIVVTTPAGVGRTKVLVVSAEPVVTDQPVVDLADAGTSVY